MTPFTTCEFRGAAPCSMALAISISRIGSMQNPTLMSIITTSNPIQAYAEDVNPTIRTVETTSSVALTSMSVPGTERDGCSYIAPYSW